MDYKDTLLLPKTDFPMRASLSQGEAKKFATWYEEEKAYRKMLERQGENFNIHDGPPYANGHLHIGHALNKILKDMITKSHYFFGDSIRYVPGWDCHGLPIEQQVEIKLKDKKVDTVKLRELCRKHANDFVDIQKKEFMELGILGDWNNPYLTMDYKFEANIYKALCKVAKKGLLLERNKPVYWSWAAKTALAEAEIEYHNKESDSVFVAFELDKDALEALGVKEAKAVIWTTTPWTLPANQAIALKPKESYVLTSENLIFAKALLESMIAQALTKGEVLKEFSSELLEKKQAINPLNGRSSIFLLGDHVVMDGGTGLVHTAPGHGEDDYYVCLKNGVEVIMPVDEAGLFDEVIINKKLFKDEVVQEFLGLHIFKANDKIMELLGDNLLKSLKITHSYPYCWRTNKPVIYRATRQWFIAMDEAKLNGKTLRQVALEKVGKTKFYPESGRNRLVSMLENRPDWCISRQRQWGVPIAFLRDKVSKEIIFDDEVMNFTYKLFKENGSDIWWSYEIKDLLPKDSKYKAENLEKVTDILDVWFDSGSTWLAVLESGNYDAGSYPSSIYLEGSDQHRGWFQSSLLLSCAINEKAPYKSIITHGFTVDENGQKMSKSKGNVIAPDYVIKNYGVEILRLWVALSDYSSDLKISDAILKQVSEQYRKIRNTIRFLLANISDLEEKNTDFTLLDKWILNRATAVFTESEAAMKNYDFSKAFNLLLNFLSSDLSGIYLDICKDRLYCDDKNSSARRSAQTTMLLIGQKLLSILAATLTYTVDEALTFAPKILKGDNKDVFALNYVDFHYNFELDGEILLASREKFFELVDQLKKDKIIKSTLELNIETNDNFMVENAETLADFFTVSKIEKIEGKEVLSEFRIEDSTFKITKAKMHKCPRCWKFNAEEEKGLCPRCQKVINNAN